MYDIETELKKYDLSITTDEGRELFWSPSRSVWKVTLQRRGRVVTIYRGDSLQTAMMWLIWGTDESEA